MHHFRHVRDGLKAKAETRDCQSEQHRGHVSLGKKGPNECHRDCHDVEAGDHCDAMFDPFGYNERNHNRAKRVHQRVDAKD